MIDELLKDTAHRPWELPGGSWQYYQEWNNAVFLHWKLPSTVLRPLIPEGLELDDFEGQSWISLVAFTMEKIRPAYLPSWSFISDFHEINLRTYVIHDHKPGVFFLNIEAEKSLSAWISRKLSGLPYEKSKITRLPGSYQSVNTRKGFNLDATFEIGKQITTKTPLERWLTERYSLYLEKNKQLFRYDIHHKEWALNEIKINKLSCQYQLAGFQFSNAAPDLVQYSAGVQVLAWNKKQV